MTAAATSTQISRAPATAGQPTATTVNIVSKAVLPSQPNDVIPHLTGYR